MIKVLLIKPRFLSLVFPCITQPLGLLYIAATLKKLGYEVKIHDCAEDDKNLNGLRRLLEDWKPDFVGMSIIITEVEQAVKITKMIREKLQNVPIILGGPWPSANPEEALKTLDADFVVLGEGETTFPQLLEAINHRQATAAIHGVVSRTQEKPEVKQPSIMTEKELNALPFPAWELLNHDLYAQKHSMPAVGRRKYMAIITSRGCPYRCAYCFHAMGNTYRKRDAQSILAELEELIFNYGFKEFEVIDDCFNLDRNRMQTLLTDIQKRFRGIRLHFPNGLRADMLEPEDAALFKKAGTVSAAFSIETASARLQTMIRKQLNVEKALRAINAFVDSGIYTTGTFMLGFPTETFEEATKTVELACRSKLHRALFLVVTPFAGTELAEMAADHLKIKYGKMPPRQVNYYSHNINISAMSDTELRTVFRNAHLRFYLNPRKVMKLLTTHPDVSALPYYALSILKRAMGT
jgi:radical SAM superfamily enzyme YgiQ (UPF0313 family)